MIFRNHILKLLTNTRISIRDISLRLQDKINDSAVIDYTGLLGILEWYAFLIKKTD